MSAYLNKKYFNKNPFALGFGVKINFKVVMTQAQSKFVIPRLQIKEFR